MRTKGIIKLATEEAKKNYKPQEKKERKKICQSCELKLKNVVVETNYINKEIEIGDF